MAATGHIQAVAASNLVDGETFTVGDGINAPTVFEFDTDSAVTGSNVAIDISALTDAASVGQAIVNAINAQGVTLGITATAGADGLVNLVADFTAAPVAITSTVVDLGWAVYGMTACDTLIGNLIDTIDSVRACVYPFADVMPYDVYLVKRKWNGNRRGDGPYTVTQNLLLSPPCMVRMLDNVHYDLGPAGREEEGEIRLEEVSLSYTEAELTGGQLEPNEEFYYKLVGRNPTLGITPRYYVPTRPPVADTIKTMGWVIHLRRAEIATDS